MGCIASTVRSVCVLACLFTLASCGGGGSGGAAIPTQSTDTVSSIEIVTTGPSIITPGTTKQYGVNANLPSGTVLALPANYATWSSSDPAIATINEYGVVTAGSNNGSTNITATYGGKSAVVSLAVKTPVSLTVATLNGQTSTVSVPLSNQPLWLDATLHFSDGTSLVVDSTAVWSSSDPSVGVIWNNSGVSPVSEGTTTITATQAGFSGSIDVTVTPPPVPTSISINGLTSASGMYAKRTKLQLSATVGLSSGLYMTATNAVWSSSDTNVFTVDANGWLAGTGGGTAILTVTAYGLSASETITMINPTSTPAVIVNCDASNPMTLSAATWNSNYATDPTNLTEWVTVDGSACGAWPYIVLVITAAPSTNQYAILQAPSYGARVYGPAITSSSTLTPQLSSGMTVIVGYKPTAQSTYYFPSYSITAQ